MCSTIQHIGITIHKPSTTMRNPSEMDKTLYMWKRHVQCKRGSHLAVQSPNCRSAAVWRNSQSGLRGRSWAPSSCLPLGRLWKMAGCGRSTTSFCWKNWKFDFHRCGGQSSMRSSESLSEIRPSASGRWRSLSRSLWTNPSSASVRGSTLQKLKNGTTKRLCGPPWGPGASAPLASMVKRRDR